MCKKEEVCGSACMLREGWPHVSGVDRVDADAQFGVLASLGLGHVVHGGLGHVVGEGVRVDLDRAQAAEVDHRAVLQRTGA